MIQSTDDGIKCKQELIINGESIWNRVVDCPPIKNGALGIYLCGDLEPVDAQVRNFKFFTHPVEN